MNLINKQPDTDQIYLYAKDPYEAKYQFLINKRESTGLKNLNNPKAFIEYSNDIQDVYKNIEECNMVKKRKISIVLHDMIAEMIKNKKLNSIVPELFIRGIKLNISIAFYYTSAKKWISHILSIRYSNDMDFRLLLKTWVKS